MSLASRLLTALVGLALVWFFWPFGSDSEVVKIVEPPPSGHQGRLFTTPLPEEPAEEQTTQAVPAKDGMDKADGDKVAAVAPQGAHAPKPKLEPTLFYRVVVRDGGTLQSGKTAIALEGIAARDADALCKDAKGRKWACGKRAQVALMRLIRGRAVRCLVPEKSNAKSVTARCTVGDTDLSVWMLSQGWVKSKAPADAKLANAADTARKKKIGVWR